MPGFVWSILFRERETVVSRRTENAFDVREGEGGGLKTKMADAVVKMGWKYDEEFDFSVALILCFVSRAEHNSTVQTSRVNGDEN